MLKKLLVQAKLHNHIEVWIPFHDIDLILLGYSNLVKEYVVDIHSMLCFRFFFHEYCHIDICKSQNEN